MTAAVRLDGPDLRNAPPFEQQLRWLERVQPSADDYVTVWLSVVADVGNVSVMVERTGAEHLLLGQACDSQEADRRVRLDAFAEHLRNSGHRQAVINAVWRTGPVADNRPNDPRATTQIVRAYVETGGRILIDPDGKLMTSPSIPSDWGTVSDQRDDEIVRAARAFRNLRHRRRAEPHIRRIVRLAGRRTSNGWLVLEGAQA